MKSQTNLFFALITSFVILCACEEQIERPGEQIDGPSIPDTRELMVIDFNTNQIHCTHTFDSLHPHVINNFGTHILIPAFTEFTANSIFKGQPTNDFGYIFPLNPVVKYVKDELSVKKIIASWNYDSITTLTNDLYFKITKIDSNFHIKLNFSIPINSDSTTLYVNLLTINRYGYASINFNHPEIDDVLVYPINQNSTNENSITITPQEFQDKYGDAFCSSLMLGTFMLHEGTIYNVKAPAGSRNEALKEAVEMVKIHLTEENDWTELVKNSQYLKNSIYFDFNTITTKGYSNSFVFGNYKKRINSADSLYQIGKFVQYSVGYLLYSDIYPRYNFINAAFPY